MVEMLSKEDVEKNYVHKDELKKLLVENYELMPKGIANKIRKLISGK